MSSSPPQEAPPSDSPPSPPSNSSALPPSDSSSSPPPEDSSSSSPPSPPPPSSPTSPPPSNDDSSSSPPPPTQSPPPNKSSPPSPPPSNDDSNNNDNNNKSPPPPKSSNGSSSSPPPPPPPPYSPPPPPRSSHSGSLPPPRHRSPPSSSTSQSDDNGSSQNRQGLIIGLAVGGALLLLVMVLFITCCLKKKKRRHQNDMYYYRDNSRRKGNGYYNSGQHGNWQSNDHVVKVPPPPGSAGISSEHRWPIASPSPPPPMMASSDMSSAAYSGPHQAPQPPPHPAVALGFNQSSFTYDDLAAATGGFAKSNLLGQGGFGYVHKGVLPNGKEVAVKSLKSNSGQGEREFQAEVDIISRVHHRHLVSLVGYCIAGSQRMLVYEFVPNNTLEYHLHGQGRPTMDWATRLKIALGSAKGFAYLHEDCHHRIIHRDIKAANILLDENFEAKVADFGLAKLSEDNHTHVSTRIMGTFGYLAPEYASSGKLTEKSDVYSYGVMLLELITGRRPIDLNNDDEDSLVDWARPILMRAIDGGSYNELVDPLLEDNFDHQEMLRMIACAASCIRQSARRRSKMSQIVRALEGDVSLDALNEGVKPGHSSAFGSSDYDGSGSYNSEVKKFRKSILSSQDFTSSEHAMTGEFVHSSNQSPEIRSDKSRFHSP